MVDPERNAERKRDLRCVTGNSNPDRKAGLMADGRNIINTITNIIIIKFAEKMSQRNVTLFLF